MNGMIGPSDREKIAERFARDLADNVRLVLFVQPPTGLYVPGRDESATGRQAHALLEELASLSEKLSLTVHNPRLEPELARQYAIERTPALVIEPERGEIGRVRFFGLPSGYEFATLLDDIVDVSWGTTRLSDRARRAAAALPGPLHLQVFVTPT